MSSWIGFELVHRHARMWNDSSIVIENKPTFLSGIMQGSGNKPPGVVPDKMMYMMRDLQRINKHTQIPINPISDPFTTLFKKGSTRAMRILTHLQQDHPELVYPAATQIWHKIWEHDLDITDLDELNDALTKAGLSATQIEESFARSTDKDVKDILKAVTQEGLEMGMFGAPSYILRQEGKDDQLFFGQDRIELLCAELDAPYYGPALEGKL